MRFLLDVCAASRRMQDALAAQGHDVLEKVTAMRELMEQHLDLMSEGTLIVVTQTRVRIRQRARTERGGA